MTTIAFNYAKVKDSPSDALTQHHFVVNINNKRFSEVKASTFQEARTRMAQQVFNYLLSLKEDYQS
jgi:hypothetical protein